MRDSMDSWRHFRGIAFVGNYLPRVCGIATFTYDLAESVAKLVGTDQKVIATAINDIPEGYNYPDRVKFEIRQDHQIDYSRAADFINFSRIDVVSLQHEYGIFGGEWGRNILAMLRDLQRPLVVTCHTVIKETDPLQKEIFEEIVARATKLVVMSERAIAFLEDIYGVSRDKIVVIPHGIHDVPFVDPNYYKDKFGVEGRQVILTFGLLHRNKGIEYVLEALPKVIERHPRTMYLVLGATHPAILRDEGEAYRLSLQRQVRELGLDRHVLFHPRFVELDELLEYIGASDICITPYLNMEQITSGALSYALGSGKAVISTPYWHAEEILAEGRGLLTPVRDAKALATAMLKLLDDEIELTAVRKKAYMYSRKMIWPAVAASYIELFDEVRSHVPKMVPTASAMNRPLAATNIPQPKLDQLIRLTDDMGPAHHARYTLPDKSYGYRLDDAAVALVATAKHFKLFGDQNAARLAGTYLALLQILVGDGTDVAAGLDMKRERMGHASEPPIGKAIWAFGYLVSEGPDILTAAANDLFQRLLPNTALTDPQGAGHAVLGAADYLHRFPGASDVRRHLSQHADRVLASCAKPGWMDEWDSPDWPIAVQALVVAASTLGNRAMLEKARVLIDDLIEVTSNGNEFFRRGNNPDEEELPVTTATFIEALGAAFYNRRDPKLLEPMRMAADWFLGENRKGKAIYDFSTGGCHDALNASGLNKNQGTEATVYCLLAFCTLHQIAGIDDTTQTEKQSG